MDHKKEYRAAQICRQEMLQALPPTFPTRQRFAQWLRGRAHIVETGYISDSVLDGSQEEWSPDPEVLEQIKKDVDKNPNKSDERISVGNRQLTWDELLVEIYNGTPFGKNYYVAYVEGLNETKNKG